MAIRHVIWDWNGTLLRDDGLGRAIMNEMLGRRGLPPLTRQRYREALTFPIIDYYRAVGLDVDGESYLALAAEWVREYEARWRQCRLEPGVAEALERIREAGVTQSILSANRHDRLLEQVDYYGLSDFFIRLDGIPDDLAYGKDHLAQVHLEALGLSSGETAYVGDTLHDVRTARAVGCRCVLVTWGHQSEERLRGAGAPLCERPEDLPALALSPE